MKKLWRDYVKSMIVPARRVDSECKRNSMHRNNRGP